MALQSPFTSQKNMKIFVLQKKFMRLLAFSDYREHTSPILKYLKVLKLQDIINFFALMINCHCKSKKFLLKTNL